VSRKYYLQAKVLPSRGCDFGFAHNPNSKAIMGLDYHRLLQCYVSPKLLLNSAQNGHQCSPCKHVTPLVASRGVGALLSYVAVGTRWYYDAWAVNGIGVCISSSWSTIRALPTGLDCPAPGPLPRTPPLAGPLPRIF
jgi:hypothetical protein